RLAVAHLRGLGHCDPVYLGPGRGTHASIAERQAGFAAVAGPGARCVRTDGSDGDADGEAVRRAFAAGWPQAVVAYNHHVARAVIHACAADGRRIPQQLSLVSCDDVRALAYPVPPVTAVRVPVRGMAERAARLLVDCIEGRERPSGQRIVVDGELQVRGSTAPPATSSSAPVRRPRRA
ncbi:MAG: LacI family DNA-binding transcriptional regulator, partial [Planctomycetes bacterium]|nr:LacI family DNA-binding transcriptional regulator [Planctomycetota bacterium]